MSNPTASESTPEEKAAEKLTYLVRSLNDKVRYGNETVAKLATALTEGDALESLRWSDSAWKAAAEVRVCGLALKALTEPQGEEQKPWSLELLRDEALRRVRNGAKWPSCSSSDQANLSARVELQVWAELEEQLTQVLTWNN